MPNASQRTSATPRETDEALPAATERASVRETLRKSAITLYAGIALLLGWFYGIWFVPAAFCNVSMMGWDVTIAWLVMLFTSAATMLAAPFFVRKRALLDRSVLIWVSALMMSAGGVILNAGIVPNAGFATAVAAPIVMAVGSGILWTLWGEYYTSIRTMYNVSQVAIAVGSVILIAVIGALAIPQPVNVAFVAVFPLLSAWLLWVVRSRAGERDMPRLAPKEERRKAFRVALFVSVLSCLASAACYFVVAIIPWEGIFFSDGEFTVGVIVGGLSLLVLGVYGYVRTAKVSIFRLFPWLFVSAAIAAALYLSGDESYFDLSYLIALAVSVVFEVLLLMYIGIFATKGYATPALSFGFSGGFIRLGVFLGNGLAILFEQGVLPESSLLTPATIACTVLMVVVLIPLVRRESTIVQMTAPVATESDLDARVDSVSSEFDLSNRETDVLRLLVRGYTAESIGKKLFISNYTVQTHVQHIYAKMDIHKRAELIDYVTHRDVEAKEDSPDKKRDDLPTYWPLPS
ncbi:LuxR family transcriptional regulator [Hugonella massiliensis]|uniref:LuxR family transcriptional regulator n=1 Tax=Hugonella massiliensis TaxID=1720315 RepID=UPI00073F2EF7|nr:LuxR family transcriptional regulator [Hugonella massiliensis]